MSMLGKSRGQYRNINVVLVGFILFDGHEFTLFLSDIASLVTLDEDDVCLGIHLQVIILREYALIGLDVDDTTLVATLNRHNAIDSLTYTCQDVGADNLTIGSNDTKALLAVPTSYVECAEWMRQNGIELEITELLTRAVALHNATLAILDGYDRSVGSKDVALIFIETVIENGSNHLTSNGLKTFPARDGVYELNIKPVVLLIKFINSV